jgi:uncharacterized membrane protein
MNCSRCKQATLFLILIFILSVATLVLFYLTIGPMQYQFSNDEVLQKTYVIAGITLCCSIMLGATFCLAETYQKRRRLYYLNIEAAKS